MGGMDKKLDTKKLNALLSKKTKQVILIPGSGAKKITNKKINLHKAVDLKTAVRKALQKATNGDIVLFSPAFTSFNLFKNEYDRGEQFMKIVKNLPKDEQA